MRIVHALVVAGALAGCTEGYDAFVDGQRASTSTASTSGGLGGASSGAGGAGGDGTSTGGIGSGAAGGIGGGSTGGGGSGGSKPIVCGDGIIDPGEQCDDSGTNPTQCSGCAVVCNGAFEHLHPTTFHCYYMTLTDGMHTSWQQGRDWCQQTWGGDLAVIGTEAERAWVATMLPQDFDEDEWIGGSDLQTEGTFEWIDQTPWSFPDGDAAWAGAEPSNDAAQNCVGIDRSGHLRDKACNAGLTHHMCERAPLGAPL